MQRRWGPCGAVALIRQIVLTGGSLAAERGMSHYLSLKHLDHNMLRESKDLFSTVLLSNNS